MLLWECSCGYADTELTKEEVASSVRKSRRYCLCCGKRLIFTAKKYDRPKIKILKVVRFTEEKGYGNRNRSFERVLKRYSYKNGESTTVNGWRKRCKCRKMMNFVYADESTTMFYCYHCGRMFAFDYQDKEAHYNEHEGLKTKETL
jgi:hypothetical protein